MRTPASRAAPALFFVTGAAGLIYQTVWMRMLIRVFGVTVYATTTVVAIFMAGLAIGAWIGGRVSVKRAPSLALWGAVEIAAGCAALVATLAIRALPALYGTIASDAPGDVSALIRVALSSACLLPPTVLMGATLPLLVAWVEAGPERGRGVAVLYGVNTLGAVLGVLFCGFVGLADFGETESVWIAVGLHALAGAYGLAVPSRRDAVAATPPSGSSPSSSSHPVSSSSRALPASVILAAALAAGLGAIGCEIAWTRLLVFLVGSSVYGFASMLAMFLFGIGAGSLVSTRLRTSMLPALFVALGVCALLSLRVVLLFGLQADDVRYLYSPLVDAGDAARFFVTSFCVVFPLTFVSGATFPLLVRAAQEAQRASASEATGRVYMFNAMGSIAGALVTGFVLLPSMGAQGAVFATAVLSFAVALVLGLLAGEIKSRASAGLAAAAAVALAFVSPSDDVTRAMLEPRLAGGYSMKLAKHVETIDTTVSVATSTGSLPPTLLLNGVFTSSKGRVGDAMAHLPLIVQPDPHRALVICFGVGSTFSAASEHVERVDAVELVREVVDSYPLFEPERAHFATRPGNRIFIDDGRNFLLRSKEKWDAVMIDGAPPIFSAGFVNLYSEEMLTLVSKHLEPRGVLMLWIPTPSWRGDIWGIVHAATNVFPQTALWVSQMSGVILLASNSPMDLDAATIDARLEARGIRKVAPWLSASLVYGNGKLLDDAEVRRRDASWPALTDDKPFTEFPLAHLLAGDARLKSGDELLTPSGGGA